MSASATEDRNTETGDPMSFHFFLSFFFLNLPDFNLFIPSTKRSAVQVGSPARLTFVCLRKALALNGFQYYTSPVSKLGRVNKNHSSAVEVTRTTLKHSLTIGSVFFFLATDKFWLLQLLHGTGAVDFQQG